MNINKQKKYHLGFYNKIHEQPLYCFNTKYIDVWDICQSNNGKIIAFATTQDDAIKIVQALNGVTYHAN